MFSLFDLSPKQYVKNFMILIFISNFPLKFYGNNPEFENGKRSEIISNLKIEMSDLGYNIDSSNQKKLLILICSE